MPERHTLRSLQAQAHCIHRQVNWRRRDKLTDRCWCCVPNWRRPLVRNDRCRCGVPGRRNVIHHWCWCCVHNWRRRDALKCRTCVALCRCEVLHDCEVFHDWQRSCVRHSWCDILTTDAAATQDAASAMFSSTCARSNVRHCRSWYEARTTRLVKAPPTCPSLCCNVSAARNSSQKECDAATPLAPLVPTSLASLVLAPSVIIGACGAKHTWARPKVGCDALVTADLIHNNAYILAEKAHVGQRTASTAIRPFGPRVAASSRWQPDLTMQMATRPWSTGGCNGNPTKP